MIAKAFATKEEILKITKKAGESGGPNVAVIDNVLLCEPSNQHAITCGITGSGKSSSGTIAEVLNALRAGESVVSCDPKGEQYAILKDHIPKNYQKVVIDFNNPWATDKLNVFDYIYKLAHSDNEADVDTSAKLLETLISSILSCDKNGKSIDPFWDNSAMNLVRGLALYMICCLPSEDVNLITLSRLIAGTDLTDNPNEFHKVDEDTYEFTNEWNLTYGKVIGLKSLTTKVIDKLKANGSPLALSGVELLSSLTTNDTRVNNDITAVAASYVNKFIGLGSFRKFHLANDVNIEDFDGTRPVAIFIILPIETDTFNLLAGVIVNQFAQQFFRSAKTYEDRCLPIRVNFILEEFGTIGKAIPMIKPLITAGRSFGIRVHIILQSYSQLVSLYGSDDANTIASNCGVTIFYRTSDPLTYSHYSEIAGMRKLNLGDEIKYEPIITQASLSSLKTFQALIMIDGHIFVSKLPLYTELL